MAVRTLAEIYDGPGLRRAIPDRNEAREFKEAVRKALGEIFTSTLGIELKREINSANWHLSVIKAGKGRENETVLERQGPRDLNNACYREVLSAKLLHEKIQQLRQARIVNDDHPAVKKYNKFYKEDTKYKEELVYKGQPQNFPIAHKSQDQAMKAAHKTENILRTRVTNLGTLKDEIFEAVGYVKFLQNGLIGYHIMSHLTPGPGTEAFVVWDPEGVDVGVGLDSSKRATWMTRPSRIGLVHELIHGWRAVTGRCVFHPQPNIEEYYEEAMTVGLPPYDGCKLTENRFRNLSGAAPRTFYGPSTKVISDTAQKKYKPEWFGSV